MPHTYRKIFRTVSEAVYTNEAHQRRRPDFETPRFGDPVRFDKTYNCIHSANLHKRDLSIFRLNTSQGCGGVRVVTDRSRVGVPTYLFNEDKRQ